MKRYETTSRAVTGTALCFLVGLAAGLGSLTSVRAEDASVRDWKFVNRITWGANPSEVRRFGEIGLDAYLEQQLKPGFASPLPPEAEMQVAGFRISTTPLERLVAELDEQNKAANALPDVEQKQAAQKLYQEALNRLGREATARSILRDLYSSNQLLEHMTWFWVNHFNVHLYKSNIRVLIGDYEERAIRPNALGRFRDLLGATLHHPAMLRYLDNDQNAAGHINENYAREIMELHTMGVGSGYSQADVQELARIFTGIGVNQSPNFPRLKPDQQSLYARNGLFEFNPARHDFGDKTFLGHSVRGSGLAETEQALDLLAEAPSTAKFICQKLAVFFVSDMPPPALVDAMASTFRQSHGDIAATVRTMFRHPAFASSLGSRFKDPMHFVLSGVRLAYDRKVILNTAPVQGWLGRLAEPLFVHETPDGFSLASSAWNGPGQMATRFEVARGIGSGGAGLFKQEGESADRPGFPVLANSLYFSTVQKTLGAGTRRALEQAMSPQEWNMLFLSSPDFMLR